MNAVVPQKSLQERVGDRIKEQIGDLLTDEDMKKLVETALHDAFFKERVIRDPSGYSSRDRIEPPAIVAQVKDLLKDRVDVAIKAWLDEHKDEFGKHIDEAVGQGFATLMLSWLDGRTSVAMMKFGEQLRQQMNKGR